MLFLLEDKFIPLLLTHLQNRISKSNIRVLLLSLPIVSLPGSTDLGLKVILILVLDLSDPL